MPLRSLARKPLPKPDARSDPRYLRVTQQLKTNATRVKVHPPAAKKAGDAAAASKGPPNERMATGKTKQVEKIQDAKAGKPEPSSFLTLLRAEIEKAMPKTLGDTEKFMQGGKSEELKGGLKGNVSQQKTESTGKVASASAQQPAPAGEAKQEVPLPKDPAAPSPKVPGGEAMPAPKSDADVSLQDSKQDVDQEMKDAKVNDRQLQKANDPRFSAVLDAKGAVAKQADSAPGQYRSQEKGVLGSAAAKANTDATKNAAQMLGVRSSSGARVLTRQQQQKAKDEAKRKEITDKIESIYNDTKARVEKKLADLDGEVNTMFDQGVDNALQVMTDYTETRIRDYKIDRYLSIPLVGQARWIRDQFKGLPEEANAFYEEGRRVFQATMDKLIVRVANLVELRLKEAKAVVAKGQADIKAFVASQPKELQQFAQAAAKEVNERFKDLEGSIEDKKNELASSLAGKYKEAFDKANEALKKIQDSNKGLVAAFVEKLGEIIKILREFKDKVMALLAKARDAIDLIVDDPIGFLGNLIAAIKGGVSKFVDNIWTHLKKGFMAWLFGSLPPGVEIPSDLSLPSILKLVLGVLGITYDKMRAKAVKLIGERNVKIIEKLVEYISVLIKGGPAALWEKIKEDLSNLKEMVIEAIMDWLITTLIKKAIEKIISMCNPVGAIIQAIIAIYNLVMFIVEKIQQILAFFEAIVNSIYNIATGAIGSAIDWIEQALARMIPVLIGFLARLIGLGGITDKIREFILKIQSKVDKAIDKVIAKIVETVKKLFGKGKGGDKEKTPGGPWDKGITAVKAYIAENSGKLLDVREFQPGLDRLKAQFGFTVLKLEGKPGSLVIDAAMSPGEKIHVDDTALVTDDKGTITVPKPEGADDVKLMVSKGGNRRLFALLKAAAKWVYNLRGGKDKGFWQKIRDEAKIKAAEEKARKWLKDNESRFKQLTNQESSFEPGFDVAGVAKRGKEDELVIGEVKGSFGATPKYFQPSSFTAITGAAPGKGETLAGNIADLIAANPKYQARINTAIASGNITIIIFLAKKAKVSAKARKIIEDTVRKDLKAYIQGTFPDVDIEDVVKNINVEFRKI